MKISMVRFEIDFVVYKYIIVCQSFGVTGLDEQAPANFGDTVNNPTAFWGFSSGCRVGPVPQLLLAQIAFPMCPAAYILESSRYEFSKSESSFFRSDVEKLSDFTCTLQSK
ncbi:hypothetical protein KAH55_05715 [bacterium]|nr:hypothetical protein [bacterium]